MRSFLMLTINNPFHFINLVLVNLFLYLMHFFSSLSLFLNLESLCKASSYIFLKHSFSTLRDSICSESLDSVDLLFVRVLSELFEVWLLNSSKIFILSFFYPDLLMPLLTCPSLDPEWSFFFSLLYYPLDMTILFLKFPSLKVR